MPTYRNDRVSEQVHKEVARILRDEVKNPHLPTDRVSVISAQVTRDMSHATVRVSVYGDEAMKKDAMQALRSASGFIRRSLGRVLTTRITPELHFELDDSIEYSIHIQEVLESIEKERNAHEG